LAWVPPLRLCGASKSFQNRTTSASNERLTASKACLHPFGGKDLKKILKNLSIVKIVEYVQE
jgi:hypothetical protein